MDLVAILDFTIETDQKYDTRWVKSTVCLLTLLLYTSGKLL